ncbi:ribosomal protein L15 [Perkinsela sp. CCAP 1560/4]|nr:ribosomal protein L15 [Perkinsela sp. CCAP 1560/4]|eukprot:KNH08322.1 ribosomal protein L15 [Perkinsela sp. CCAP 1560/4]
MGAYAYMNELWRKKGSEVMTYLQRLRAWEYRHQKRIVSVTRSTRPEKARRLGYKRKTGYCLYRVRIRRGGHKRPVHRGITYGKPKTAGVLGRKLVKNSRVVAEQRIGKKFGNIRVLNSYWVNQDSVYKWFEVICVDPQQQVIRNDPEINWICNPTHKHREVRGLTSAGRKHRGLRNRGSKANKLRPSKRAVWKKHKTVRFWRYR